MDDLHPRARFDWLMELGGAIAPGLAAGFAAFKLAPSLSLAPELSSVASAGGFFAIGLAAMRAVTPEPRKFGLRDFGFEPLECQDEPLLLDTPHEEPLLLDDPLVEPSDDSRVVRLFASQPLPTPGQLKERIDRHLATGAMHVVHEFEGPAPDAADALYAALADLRRSLR